MDDNIRVPDQNYIDRLIDDDEIIDRINKEPNNEIRNIMILSYEENIRHRKEQDKIERLINEAKVKSLIHNKEAEKNKHLLKKKKEEALLEQEKENDERRAVIQKITEWISREKDGRKYEKVNANLREYIKGNQSILLSTYNFLLKNGIRPKLLEPIKDDLYDDTPKKKSSSRENNSSSRESNDYTYDEDDY